MKKELNKILLEAISNGVALSLDNFDDDDIQIQTHGTIKDTGKGFIQKGYMNTQITLKVFIYELLKRLPNSYNKKDFAKFGFVNYKVTGNKNDWPYLVSLNPTMTDRLRENYQRIFYTKNWTCIQSFRAFTNLLQINNDIFPNYRKWDKNTKFGKDALEYANNCDPTWKNDFHGKYDDTVNIIRKFAEQHPNLKNNDVIIIDFVAFSNDGAFYVIMYETKNEKLKYVNHVEIHCTENIIDEKSGLDLDEEKNIASKQRNFKSYLKKKILFDDEKFPDLLTPNIISNQATYSLSVAVNTDLDYRIRVYQRIADSQKLMERFIMYDKKGMDARSFMWRSLYDTLYIDEREDVHNIYDKLRVNSQAPYIVASSKNGDYLIAFYQESKDYRKNIYQLLYTIIDNRDFSIMPEDYLEQIKYNYTK